MLDAVRFIDANANAFLTKSFKCETYDPSLFSNWSQKRSRKTTFAKQVLSETFVADGGGYGAGERVRPLKFLGIFSRQLDFCSKLWACYAHLKSPESRSGGDKVW